MADPMQQAIDVLAAHMADLRRCASAVRAEYPSLRAEYPSLKALADEFDKATLELEVVAAALRTAPEVIRIPAGDGLDPITLYVEDAGNGSGHLTITCYADAWTCYWGSMGCGLTEFAAGVGADYLLSCMLWPNLGSTSKKTQAYVKRIAQRVIDQLAARPQGVKDGR